MQPWRSLEQLMEPGRVVENLLTVIDDTIYFDANDGNPTIIGSGETTSWGS